MDTQNDVNQDSSPENQDVKVENVPQQEGSTEEQVNISEDLPATPPSSGEGNLPVGEVDEKGVPYENRYREQLRKTEKLETKITEMSDVLKNIQQSVKPEEPQYTIADLETYKQQHPEHAAWCEQEKARLIEEGVDKRLQERFAAQQRAQQETVIKQQALSAVAQNFPQAFAQDASGRLVDWDMNSPLTQRIIHYMESGHKNAPDGLLTAAKLAAFDLGQGQTAKTQQALQRKQAELGNMQRKTAVEGSSVQYSEGGSRSSAVARAVQTGDSKDAREALRQMFIDKGTLRG